MPGVYRIAEAAGYTHLLHNVVAQNIQTTFFQQEMNKFIRHSKRGLANASLVTETSANSRAGCQNKECKDAGIKIQKGELRFGTFVTISEHQTWRWKHWGCVTPVQIHNLNEVIEGDVNIFDGYDELDENEQEKVAKALEEGHVADDDWKGDVEVNRVGMKGFRVPASKKKEKDEDQAQEEGSPTKPKPKKRGRPKNIAEEEPDEEDPAPKKTKVSAKRRKKVKAEPSIEDGESAKKGRKNSTKVKKEVPSLPDVKTEEDVEKPVKAKRRRPRKNIKVESENDDDDDDDIQAQAQADSASENMHEEEVPQKRKGRKSAVKTKTKAKSRVSKTK